MSVLYVSQWLLQYSTAHCYASAVEYCNPLCSTCLSVSLSLCLTSQCFVKIAKYRIMQATGTRFVIIGKFEYGHPNEHAE